jgi:porin
MHRLLVFPTLFALAVFSVSASAQESFLGSGQEFPLGQPLGIEPVAYSAGVAGCDGAEPGCCGSGACANPCCSTCLLHRENLFGAWCGLRPALASHGIIADLQLTQFYQGVASGGNEELFKYGGKLDYNFIFLGEQLGLNKGFKVLLHAETRFGEDITLDAVPLAASNANMLYPSLENETAITGLLFMQALSPTCVATVGKFNSLDLIHMLYPQTGRGIDGFMNMSTFMPLTLARTLPLSFLGTGLLKMRDQQTVEGGLLVYDSNNVSTTCGFDEVFDNGANIAAFWRFFTCCGGLPGSHLFLGTYATGDFTSLDPIDWGFIPGQGIVAEEQSGSWSALYILEQKLWVDRCNPKRNIGLLSKWGLSDPDTCPYEWIGIVSLQGQGLNRCRPQDSIGAGYFYSGLSGQFKDLLSIQVELEDVQGVELYYNAAVTPWFHLTADLQIVEPAAVENDTAVVVGIRGKLSL